MDEMLAAVRRGWGIAVRAKWALLWGGFLWSLAVPLTYGLLLGPALVGLFTVALRAMRNEEVNVTDNFRVFDDVAAPFVAGVAFYAPFALWNQLSGLRDVAAAAGGGPGFSLLLVVALLLHFAFFIHVFAILADDRPRLTEAVGEALRLAEPHSGQARYSSLARHLTYCGLAFVGLVVIWQVRLPDSGIPFLVVVGGPLAIALLTPWYAQRRHPGAPVTPAIDAAAVGVSDLEDLDAEDEAARRRFDDEP